MTLLRYTILAATIALAPVAAQAQQTFSNPEQAAQALVDALHSDNQAALQKLLGKNWRHYLPAKDSDRQEIDQFLHDWQQNHHIIRDGKTAHLAVGGHNWVLPMPVVENSQGWRFDLPGAANEIRIRTIGRNELSAIQAVLAYADAQREYKDAVHQGGSVRAYAQKLISSPGKQDGLYWSTADGAPTSPLGPAFGNSTPGSDYHGYHYRILTAQGPQAHGGAFSYLQNGQMTKGFALIAWPASYGNSGVFSFMINQDGTVYQKDLGSNTGQAAKKITAFNPDSSWSKVPLSQVTAQSVTD